MDNAVILPLLEADLDMLDPPTERVSQLTQLIGAAKELITQEGVTLSETSLADVQIVVMYAAWLYRKRSADNAPMPRMLRYALNNRILHQKASEADVIE